VPLEDGYAEPVALPPAEPMPEAVPDAEPEAVGPVELHAASANAQAKDRIHLVIVAPLLLPMKSMRT
jgi:hypothetical protein